MRIIDEILIHCSATADHKRCDIATIREWHLARGWKDVGYHFVIQPNGGLQRGRPIEKVGAHCRGHNRHSVGICLVGGLDSSPDDDFSDHYTQAQQITLMELCRGLVMIFGPLEISGHNEYTNKACPGFRVKETIIV